MMPFFHKLLLLLATFSIYTQASELDERFPYRHKMGVNTGGVSYYSSNVALADAIKMARPFLHTGKNAPYSDIDKHLYPRSVPEAGLESSVINEYYPAGDYVITWQGDAAFSLEAEDPEDGSEIELIESEPNRLVYRVDPKGLINLRLHRMDKQDPLRELHVWLPGLENAESPWNPAWLKEAAPFGVYRFMDMMATNRSEISAWEQRPTPDLLFFSQPRSMPDGFPTDGIPAEWLIELCNIMEADPWFTLPHLATDRHVREFAKLVKRTLSPDRKVYLEWSNEVFNAAFSQCQYSERMGRKMGFDSDDADSAVVNARFYSHRSKEVFEIWREVFGAEKERITGVVTISVRHERKMDESRATLAFEDNYKHFDAVSFAPYTGVGIGRRFDMPFEEMDEEDLMAQLIREQAIQIRTELDRAKALADEFDLPLLGYEGGQHLSFFGGAIPQEHKQRFGELVPKANAHELMENFYWHHLRDWYTTTNGVYCHFVLIAPPISGYSWGLKEYVGQPLEDAPKARPFWEMSRQGRFLNQE